MSSLPQSDSSNSNQPACCSAKKKQQGKSAGSPGRKTRSWFLIGSSILFLLVVVFWRPLQQQCLAYFLLRAEAPSEEALSGAVEHASDPVSILTELWRSQRIPHRQFVIHYLGRVATTEPDLFRAMEPVVLEAARDSDIATRESAFATLARMKHTQLRSLALEQLSDADPAARLIGLQHLRSIASSNDVPIAIHFLNDPEPRVVVAAALVLRQATGLDFGIRSTHAMPQFICIDTNPPPAPDLAAIRQGVQLWQEWWTTHQGEFPAALAEPTSPAHEARLATADFALEDSDGKLIRLSQFLGKTVLLSFWSSGAPASLDDVPSLKKLQQRYSDHLAVLGVSIPAAPSCADEHEHGHERAHHHHDEAAGGMAGMAGPEHMRCSVQDAVTRLKTNYPMVSDTKDVVGLRFSIEDLPAYVLIDAEGMVRRRFVGFRSESALTAIIEEVATPSAVRASAN